MRTVVSIDGGGVLAVGPVAFMRSFEATVAGFHFKPDLIAGTSAGGMLALMAASGKSWYEMEYLFTYWSRRIFARPPWRWRIDPFRPKYQDDGLKKAVESVFKGRRCCDALVPFRVPTFDNETGRPKIIDETDSITMAEACLRTTAAPTYFQPRDGRWIDGALVANDPSMIGITALVRSGAPVESICCLSLGTGGSQWTPRKISRRTPFWGWAMPVINSQMAGNEEAAEFQASALLGARHLRIEPKLTSSFSLDSVDRMDDYRRIWEATFRDNAERFRAWLSVAES